jgi:hypothetical protein
VTGSDPGQRGHAGSMFLRVSVALCRRMIDHTARVRLPLVTMVAPAWERHSHTMRVTVRSRLGCDEPDKRTSFGCQITASESAHGKL